MISIVIPKQVTAFKRIALALCCIHMCRRKRNFVLVRTGYVIVWTSRDFVGDVCEINCLR